ncbi:Predicted oxidoreductase, aldo/keto reductase family [Prochlorococcus marinus subsp. marinus str. CCMP1375]|uniref:Predicted oxidoreductase, aldo/keto reductase family n=2 Tax=Prochlorococcaceae TaxID=2881426 RepID=Q7VDE2_PROMA|nr:MULTISPECIES: aldo/keto reductase [Prochlorococcus]AAP99483.1 Predicted oxidoreductase, aldo/keto reductase family [Prochlorococcus marinus subsp. marinus str. CCMP1375]
MSHKRNPFGLGPEVSLFTLGTMRAIESIDQMYLILKEAYFAGINHIETSPAYGPAEIFLGESLKKLKAKGIEPRGGWIITSKLLPSIKFSNGKKQLKGIIKRLGISKVHNLAIHGLNLPEHLNWALQGEGAELLKWAQSEDLIGQVGFSSHGSFQLINEAIESNQFNFCSLHLHLLDQERIPLAQAALKKGMGVIAISPADKGGHLHTPSQTLIEDCSPFKPLELAYRYLLSQGISTLTLGANKTKDLYLAKKLGDSNSPLSSSEKLLIDRLMKNITHRLGNTFCGQCRECLPCPNEVPIPNILRLRNLDIGLNLQTFSKERYNLIGKAGHWWEKYDASACMKCGDCLPRCPNNLNIPELLEETHSKLIDKPERRLWG